MKKNKLAKLNVIRKGKGIKKYDEGGNLPVEGQGSGMMSGFGVANQFVGLGAGYMEQKAIHDDGSVNKGQYTGAEALKWGAKGAEIGSQFGPWGTLIGAGAGAIGGAALGASQADKMNGQAKGMHEAEARSKQDMINQKEQARQAQQKLYSQAYYASNPTYGTKGASLMAFGGSTNPNDGNPTFKTLGEYRNYYSKLGYINDPRDSKNSTSMYNPKQYGYDKNTNKFSALSPDANVDASGNPLANHFVSYTSSNFGNNKPIITPTSTQSRTLDSFGHQVLTDKTTGKVTYLDKFGNPLQGETQPLVSNNAMGGYAKSFAYGGSTPVPGGKLTKLAKDTVVAEGNTHQQGGIDLQENGKTYAEIEKDEVVDGNQVYSARLKLDNGKTYAEMAEKFGKEKGKAEEKTQSLKTITANTGKRTLANATLKLDELFQHQQLTKEALGIKDNSQTPKFSNGGSWANAGSSLVPYIDNAYNQYLINKTPQVPEYTTKEAINETALPLKTNYNIDPALYAADTDYKRFKTNVDQNTSNSNDAKGNKLAAFSSLLTNKSNLYGQKENIETQLKNQDLMNTQGVLNRNTQNAQDIRNTNLAQQDKYNWAKMERTQNMNLAKSANVANATEDAIKGIQDKNMKNLDEEKIMTDSLKYNNGAGFARLVGSKTMDNLIKSDSRHYTTIEKALKDSNQVKALADFYNKYGQPK
jgi:hypothetical protein